ncbi:hypothetical protein, partial [Sinorhizobium medicae]|uniref:hypothetical protein n=1 Tax=Sinorhizobium medicae TaxID=110321 RepID=UPI002B1BE4E2
KISRIAAAAFSTSCFITCGHPLSLPLAVAIAHCLAGNHRFDTNRLATALSPPLRAIAGHRQPLAGYQEL